MTPSNEAIDAAIDEIEAPDGDDDSAFLAMAHRAATLDLFWYRVGGPVALD